MALRLQLWLKKSYRIGGIDTAVLTAGPPSIHRRTLPCCLKIVDNFVLQLRTFKQRLKLKVLSGISQFQSLEYETMALINNAITGFNTIPSHP